MQKKFNKSIIIIIFSFLTVAIIGLYFLITRLHLFRKSQVELNSSVKQGYGFYGDPIEGPCITSDGKCNSSGLKKVTKRCIVNPVTKKGCLLSDGTMSFDNLVQNIPCNKQCVGSTLEINDGLLFEEKTSVDGDALYTVIQGSKGGYIVNQYGIDYTDEYLEGFDSSNNTYKLKRCLENNDYQIYSIQTLNCTQGDNATAGNKCTFTCGVDDQNTLRIPLVKDVNLGIKTYKYPKINNRYSCLDIFGNNQIEIFNSGNIPNNFIFPETCYQIYDQGTSPLYTKAFQNIVTSDQRFFTLTDFNLGDYDIHYNYESYYPINIGYKKGIVESFYNTKKSVDKTSLLGYLYMIINDDSKYNQLKNTILPTGLKPIDKTTSSPNMFYISLNNLISPTVLTSQYFFENNSVFLNFPNTENFVINDYIFYTITNTVDSQFGISQVVDVNTSTTDHYIELNIANLGEDAYINGIEFYKLNQQFVDLATDGFFSLDSYFLSEIDIVHNSITLEDDSAILVNNNVLDSQETFYLYSHINREFYYPVSTQNLANSVKFTIPDYNLDFYLLEGGIKDSIYPPNKDLKLQNFENLVMSLQTYIIKASKDGFNYIKNYSILNKGVSDSYSDSNFTMYDKNFNSLGTVTLSINQSLNRGVVKILGNLPIDISDQVDSPTDDMFIEKMSIYSSLISTNNNFINSYSDLYTIEIYPQKTIVKTVDYSVFKSPKIVDSITNKTKLSNICFDNTGKNFKVGTKINLQPGEKVVYYKKSTLNANDYNCGFYGVSGNLKINTPRLRFTQNFGTSVIIPDSDIYNSYQGFLDPGYNLEPLYCYKKDTNELLESNIKNCQEPFITKIYNDQNLYNSNEMFYKNILDKSLYFSKINNNTESPIVKTNNWDKLLDINFYRYAYNYSSFYDLKGDYYYVYDTSSEGVIGEKISNYAVDYLFTKNSQKSIYNIPSPVPSLKFYQNNYFTDSTNNDRVTARGVFNDSDDSYIYNIGLSSRVIKDNFYQFSIGVSSGLSYDRDNYGTGDFINPDFNLFNSIIINDGVSIFKFPTTNSDNIINGSSIINDVTKISDLNVNSLACLAYGVNSNDFINGFRSIDNLYNYSFEVCKVLGYDEGTSVLNLERNLLNYPRENIYYNSGLEYVGFLLDPNLNLDMLYNITNFKDNTIYFNFNAYSNSTPDINAIKKNIQSRTALSARIIKKNVSVANAKLDNNSLYLLESPDKNRLISYLERMEKKEITNGQYEYYFNQYSANQYKNNKTDPFFNKSDVVSVSFQGKNYLLTIQDTKVYYNDLLYDYRAIGGNIDENMGNYIDYYTSVKGPSPTTNIIYIAKVTKSIDYQNNNSLTINNDQTIDVDKLARDSYPFFVEVSEAFPLGPEYNTSFQRFQNQKLVDSASLSLPIISLYSTRLYTDIDNINNYLEINNIKVCGKPYGISYLEGLATNNTLDIDGYSSITSFEIGTNNLDIIPGSKTILLNRSGFKFSFAQKIANFTFKKILRKSTLTNLTSLEPQIYRNGQTYSNGNIVEFNYNQKLFYQNNTDNTVMYNEDSYNQPYYLFSENQYKYPLYLNSENGKYANKLLIPGTNLLYLYYNNLTTTTNNSITKNSYYKEFIITSALKVNTDWRQISESRYPLLNLNNYQEDLNYANDDLVIYEKDVYSSVGNNYNNTPDKNLLKNWSFNNSYGEIFSTKEEYYNINTGNSTNPVDLVEASKLDITNVPISIIDYSDNSNYTIDIGLKGIRDLNFDNSFINDLSHYNIYKEVLAKALIFNDNNTITSLASFPPSKDNLINYGFLKQIDVNEGNVLSQYVYNINLPNKDYTGKSFCTGVTPFNSGVSNFVFANSVLFLPVPVEFKDQDFPLLDTTNIADSDDKIFNITPNVFSTTSGVSVYYQYNDSYNNTVLDLQSSNYLSIDNINLIETGFLAKFTSPSTYGQLFNYNIETDQKNYYISKSNSSVTTGQGVSIVKGQPWYLRDNNQNLIADGFFTDNKISVEDLVASKQLVIITIEESLVDLNKDIYTLYFSENIYISNIYIYSLGNSIVITNPSTVLTTGEYHLFSKDSTDEENLTAKVELSFVNNKLVNFNQVGISSNVNTDSELFSNLNHSIDQIYFPYQEDNLKIKMYGFFGSSYLSPILYSEERRKVSNEGEIPALIFSPFVNKLINPYNNSLELVDSVSGKVAVTSVPETSYSNVFNLINSNGKLDLKSNFYKYPVFDDKGNININNKSFPLNLSADKGNNSSLGVINTPSVINLTSEGFSFSSYVSLGNYQDVIPFDDKVTKNVQIYKELKSGANTDINNNLDCSIYSNNAGVFRTDLDIDVIVENGPNGKVLNYFTEDSKGNIVTKTSLETLLYYNTSNNLNQNNTGKNSDQIYVGISPGIEFSDSVVLTDKNIDSNRELKVKYFLNNVGVSQNVYYSQNPYQSSIVKSIQIVLTNSDYFNSISPKNVYLGYKDSDKTLKQFTEGLSVLTFNSIENS